MKAHKSVFGTANSQQDNGTLPESLFSFLSGQRKDYATNLFEAWSNKMLRIYGYNDNTVKSYQGCVKRLITFSGVAPWELRPKHVEALLSKPCENGKYISPSTTATYCASWRSFQGFMLEPDIANEIQSEFQVRPMRFVTDENSIAVKRYKLNSHTPKSWALTPDEINRIDEEFVSAIKIAHSRNSKSFLPLVRDRVMFHVAIHFALRVSELTSIKMGHFSSNPEPKLAKFKNLGLLKVKGKNDVTGTVPMRDPDVYKLLEWYISNVRMKFILRRNASSQGDASVAMDLLFPSERGGKVDADVFRRRLAKVAMGAGVLREKLTPHTLRHTGCTLMVPLYSVEVSQGYMRHKHLFTTLGYYHPVVLDAANQPNKPLTYFDDED